MRPRCVSRVFTVVSLCGLLLGVALPVQAAGGGQAALPPGGVGLLSVRPSIALDVTATFIDDDWAGLPPGTPVFFPGDPVSHTIGFDAFATIQEGVDAITPTGTVNVADGVYSGTLNIVDRSDIEVVGLDRDTVVVRPSSTLCFDVGGYGCARRAAFRVVNSTGISFYNGTFDFADVAGNNRIGFLYWDSSGTLDNNVLENMSLPDISGYYYEITSYFRAPSYTETARAEIVLHNNLFTDTGRLGFVSHDFVHLTIEGNTFAKAFDDFGYAMEIGSRSTAVISGNVFYGYDTPAASDGSVSAAMYIENCFTGGLPHITKTVVVQDNDIYGNQYGIFIGNEWTGYAGDVDILAEIQGNSVHDNLNGGIYVVDEGRDVGSSVTVAAAGNEVANNGPAGFYFNTYGNGELHASLAENSITGHDAGVLVENWGGAGSLYDLAGHHNRIVGNVVGVSNTTGVNFVGLDNWWGCNDGPGAPGCDATSGSVSCDPWLVLDLSAVPDVLPIGASADLTADLTWNNVPTDTLPWGHIPDGVDVAFAATMGTVAPSMTATIGGMAASVFTAGPLPGTAVVSTTVDNQTVTTTVTIVEPLVQFSAAAYGVDEAAGVAVISVTLDTLPGMTVTVDYATLGGTASPGGDYTPVSGTLAFAPGQGTVTFTVPILDDNLDEPDETVGLSLANPVNAGLGTPYTATLTIVDDDPLPSVRFDRSDYSVGEGAGSAILTVTLSAPSIVTVTVDYATSGGTASPGGDYAPVSGTLTFAPGQAVVTLSVPILDDNLDEPDETVGLSLANPVNAGLGTPYTATLTIVDDDPLPSVRFDRSDYSVGEGAGLAILTVTLSAPSIVTVTVDYATLGGTASPGGDYTPVSGTLTFAPGQVTVTFTVPILNDTLHEPSETVGLSLTNPVNAGLGAPYAATLTIVDDDLLFFVYLPAVFKAVIP